MNRLQRLLANPYKIRALTHRLFRGVRQQYLKRELVKVSPATLGRYWQTSDTPAEHFRMRTQPRFFFDVERIPTIRAATPPEGQERILSNARQALSRTFTFRGCAPVTFPAEIDWGRTVDDDLDWNADLHRLDWLVTTLLAAHYTRDGKFAEYASAVLPHWWQANPPGSPPWHDPFEVAQRSNTLSWILFLGAPLAGFSGEALRTVACALLASGRWVETTLEYHTPNNHLFIQAIRLAQLGLLFPEFIYARRWFCRGLDLFQQELERQILPDGVHIERSVFYQRLVFEVLLEFLVLAQRNTLRLPPVIYEQARKMLLYLLGVRRPDGEFPLFGDGFRADILLRYDVLTAGAELLGIAPLDRRPEERTLWLLNGYWLAPQSPYQIPASQLWEAGGYVVLNRDQPEGQHQLIFDCGEFGLAAAPGHGHADCLSLEVSAFGRPFVIDPGSYSWHRGEHWRNAFRCTRAHNTVVVDGEDQTSLSGIFAAGPFASPTLRSVMLGDRLRLLDASHDGYTRLRGKVIHRRTILDIPQDGWLVIDSLTGQGRHTVEIPWHFHPQVLTAVSGTYCQAYEESGTGLHLAWSANVPLHAQVYRGQENPPYGWVSFTAGRKEPADVLVLSASLDLPAWIATLLVPYKTASRTPQLSLLSCTGGVAFTCHVADSVTHVFLAAEGARGGTFAEWSTDARVAVVREATAGISREQDFLLVEGRSLKQAGEERVQFATPAKGITLTIADGRVSIAGDMDETVFPVHLNCGPLLRAFVNNKAAKIVAGTKVEL
jgi:hypothetical protein